MPTSRRLQNACGLASNPIVRARLTIVLLACLAAARQGYGVADDRHSVIAPLAPQSLLLDAATANGKVVVVVGERGHVLVGAKGIWTQMAVPTQTTLTGIHFATPELAWAVGHDAVILRTQDGGKTWERVHYAPQEETPLFDVWFKDENHGLAIGAYGLFLSTSDGGATWSRADFTVLKDEADASEGEGEDQDRAVDDDDLSERYDVHLNRIARSENGRLYIAAEGGNIYRSDDDGRTWRQLPSPYHGSFFGVLPLAGDGVLVFGLRGSLYRSQDAGETWKRVATSTQEMLTDGLRLKDGTLVIVGLGGVVLVSEDNGQSFTLRQQVDRRGLSAIAQSDDGSIVLVGEGGVKMLSPQVYSLQSGQ